MCSLRLGICVVSWASQSRAENTLRSRPPFDYLGLVVGSALAANTVVAVMLGGILPLLLKRMKMDPALVSSPLLTTVTDMCGFFFVLSFATAVMAKLSGV